MKDTANIKKSQLFYTIIKNRNSTGLNRSMIGYKEEYTTDPIDKNDMLDYIGVIGDENTQYNSGLFVCPFYISKLIFPYIKKLFIHKDLNFNLLQMVHGDQEYYWHRNITIGDQLTVKLHIEDIYDIAVGEMMQLNIDLYSLKRHVAEVKSGIIIRDKIKKHSKQHSQDESKEVLYSIPLQTYKNQAQDYARVSLDNNYIHTNKLIAKLAGLPGPILHGVCVLGMTYSHLMKTIIRNDLNRFTGIACRFSGYVLPGEALLLQVYTSSDEKTFPFAVFNSQGKAVLKSGMFYTKKF